MSGNWILRPQGSNSTLSTTAIQSASVKTQEKNGKTGINQSRVPLLPARIPSCKRNYCLPCDRLININFGIKQRLQSEQHKATCSKPARHPNPFPHLHFKQHTRNAASSTDKCAHFSAWKHTHMARHTKWAEDRTQRITKAHRRKFNTLILRGDDKKLQKLLSPLKANLSLE